MAMGSVPVVPLPLARAVTKEVDAERLGLRSWLCQNLGLLDLLAYLADLNRALSGCAICVT